MRTTMTVDDDIMTKLRERSKLTGKSFKEVINEALRIGLIRQENLEQKKPTLFKVKTRSLGMKAGFTYDNVAELLEQLEGPQYK